MKRALPIVSLLLVAGTFAAGLAEVVINGNNSDRTIESKGANVTVNGNKNTVRILDSVPTLRVAGNGNVIRVKLVGKIDVPGNVNRIEWHGSRGGKPQIVNHGTGNVIVHK